MDKSDLARPDRLPAFIGTLAFWICITFFDFVGLAIDRVTRLLHYWSNRAGDELGQAIGCDNPLLYNIEIDFLKHHSRSVNYGDLVAIETSQNVGSIGMVINRRILLNKQWLRIYLLQDEAGEILKINLKSRKLAASPKSVFSASNLVFALDTKNLDADLCEQIRRHPMYRDRDYFVGCVSQGSNINTINFSILSDDQTPGKRIAEGVILKVPIYGEDTLYQVINGNTREEHLENFDSHGFTMGIARKLGRYDAAKLELNVCKWMPSIYSPMFFAFNAQVSQGKVKEIAKDAIGRLPDTDLAIPLGDVDAMVTHNTAILGILGIGKSCLAYELIQKISAKGIKVICIDITNEYRKELLAYLPAADSMVFDDENAFNIINAKYEYIHTEGQKQNPEKSGNINEYKAAMRKDLCQFLFNADAIPESRAFDTSKKVRIHNLDYHKASRGEKIGFNVITTDLTQAEKTRVVAEELFKILLKLPLADEKRAKVLLVFEEAHSLIPEWNSVANDGDRNAANGTAKVILQGRKYGLGSLVVTQRTANVSKSILNQCNTIFALRVFDDTGKGFLENYIGRDYADTLATLDERHAIAIGKGLKLKQPVIIQLNDKDDVAASQTAPVVVNSAPGGDTG